MLFFSSAALLLSFSTATFHFCVSLCTCDILCIARCWFLNCFLIHDTFVLKFRIDSILKIGLLFFSTAAFYMTFCAPLFCFLNCHTQHFCASLRYSSTVSAHSQNIVHDFCASPCCSPELPYTYFISCITVLFPSISTSFHNITPHAGLDYLGDVLVEWENEKKQKRKRRNSLSDLRVSNATAFQFLWFLLISLLLLLLFFLNKNHSFLFTSGRRRGWRARSARPARRRIKAKQILRSWWRRRRPWPRWSSLNSAERVLWSVAW